MFTLSQISGFVLRFVIIYVILVAPWPGSREAYAWYVDHLGATLLSSIKPDVLVRFSPVDESLPDGYRPPENQGLDVQVLLTMRRSPHDAAVLFSNSHNLGHIPTAFVVALILATPIRWSRKWRSALWGLFWINVYVALKLAVWLVYCIEFVAPFADFGLNCFWRGVLRHVYEVVVHGATGGHLLPPLLIWILVSVRRADWNKFPRATPAAGLTDP